MFYDALFQLAAITGSAATKRRLFWIFSVLSVAFQAAAIMTLIPLLERLFTTEPRTALPWLSAMIGLFLLTWIMDVISFKIGFELGCCIVTAVERRGIATIAELDLAELHSKKAAKLAKLVATAGSESLSSIIHLLFPLLQALLITPFLSVLLLFISWKIAIVAAITGLLLLLALASAQRLGATAEQRYDDSMRAVNDAALEFAWAQPTLRTAGVSKTALDKVLRSSYQRGLRLLLWQIPGETVFSMALQLGLVAFGMAVGLAYSTGDISGITAAALIVVLLRIVEASGSLSLLATPLNSVVRVFRQINNLSPATESLPVKPQPKTKTDSITLCNLSYHYPGTTAGIENINLTLVNGSITVIVGESGSGKSTLLDVLSGLREHTTGTISFDDTTMAAADRLAQTSMMFQHTELRLGTLADNIPTHTDSQRETIAKTTQLTEVVARLPLGWQTQVGEGGGNLSGGERQRVGLARALAKSARLLLVDEATAALDSANEQAIVTALDSLRGQRTLVIVTHRPALVRIADQIVVLKNGTIAETGTLAELKTAGGIFATMWQRWQDIENWTV